MGIIGGIRRQFPDAEIHWVTRSDMTDTLSIDPRIDKVWSLGRKEGFDGLVKLSKELKAENFDYVYDAHLNIRSKIIRLILKLRLCHFPHFAIRKKNRFKRYLLFKHGINRFEWPFIGVDSFRKPLRKWGIKEFDDSFASYIFPEQIVSKFEGFADKNTVTLVPSANWEMKRWPVSHWQSLIKLLPDCKFIILGGPSDHFCEDIRAVAPERVVNMAGKSTIMESNYIVSQSWVVVSGDTGFMHSADLFRVPTIALMGPTAFGFPARTSTEVFNLKLDCQPCSKDGRGECKDSTYQRCMAEITPQRVAQRVQNIISNSK